MSEESRWLLLIHQIPPKPDYFRVKVWRRLQRIGAVAVKSSVYALPRSDQALEDLQWILREIVAGGGDASICEAHFVDGLSDEQLEAIFRAARDTDYAALVEDARRVAAGAGDERAASVVRLRRRLADVVAIDFCAAAGRAAAEAALAAADARIAEETGGARPARAFSGERPRNRTWVTRRGIHVDRIASAWLVRRFVDPEARFKWVAARGYAPQPAEIRFDMFDAEYTHEADRCTFEVLADHFAPGDPGLRAIAEMVHDVDLKDGKFGRAETPGFERMIAGVALAHREDDARLARGSALLDDLYEAFRKKPA